MGTLAAATCAVADGSISPSDARGFIREGSPQDWLLIQSWTRSQIRVFADLAIADGMCMPGANPGLDLGS